MTTDSCLCVAFIWHMHQPLYREPLGGPAALPWVRFHAVKDYLDMPLTLEQFPGVHQTFNLVPILIEQLDDYGTGRLTDRVMVLSGKPVADLSPDERAEVLGHFFELNWECLLRPHHRYRELLEKWQQLHLAGHGSADMVPAFSAPEWEDLLMWYNLAWVDPWFVAADPDLQLWLARGRDFTYTDRQQLLAKHLEIIRQILPNYRRLQERGQIEVTTTPYAHPILPLLLDSNSARRSRPQLPGPVERVQWPEDAAEHLDRALALYQEVFGEAPAGLWPAEQAISPEVLSLIGDRRLKWIVSDEGVLARSQEQPMRRDTQGLPIPPDRLYRPYRLPPPAEHTAIVFRDAVLSDLIGFSYGPGAQREGARDFYHRLLAIHERCPTLPDGNPPLVTIALDGENCWEHYRRDGHDFLQTLYALCAHDPRLRLLTVREYLQLHPPQLFLSGLHSGSWIYADFSTWIGEPAKNRAWELLAAARRAYVQAEPTLTETARRRAREHLLVAEGSDWFWWFGEGHTTAQKGVFDRLFRHHLQAIYAAIGRPQPEELHRPVRPAAGPGLPHWQQLQTLELAGATGSMQASGRPLERLRAGYSADGHLRLQVIFAPTPPDAGRHLLIGLFYPGYPRPNARLPLPAGGRREPILEYLFGHTVQVVTCNEHLQAWLEEADARQHWQPRGWVDAAVLDNEGREWHIDILLQRLGLSGALPIAVVACLLDQSGICDVTREPLLLPPCPG